MMAPASVPQVMMVASFHHCVVSPPSSGMMSHEARYVSPMETNEVIHTSEVSGASKFMSSALAYLALDRKSTRLNSSHVEISYAVFCLKKKKEDKLARVIE